MADKPDKTNKLKARLPRGMPSASIVSAAIMHISASAAIAAEPTVSASNCMNWRKRPGPGFSLRNTKPSR